MIRRSVVALIAALAMLLPAAGVAQATYAPPEADMAVSDSAVLPGEVIVVEIFGEPGLDATLQVVTPEGVSTDVAIAGVKELTKTIESRGLASFGVRLFEPGVYNLVGFVEGERVGSQVVRVLGPGRDGADPGGADGGVGGDDGIEGGGTAGDDALSDTGVFALPWVLTALGLVVFGVAGVLLARRRSQA